MQSNDSSSPTLPPHLAGERPTLVLGLRRSALVELALFLAAAFAVDAAFFDATRFVNVVPHPFWLIVLLLSMQYGVREGLLAAAVTGIALYAGNLPAQKITQDFYAYLLTATWQPFLWCLTAVGFGYLRSRQVAEREQLSDAVQQSHAQNRRLADAYRKLSEGRDSLEVQLAGQLRSAISIYEAARSMETFDWDEAVRSAAGLIRSVLAPEKFSIFIKEGSSLIASVMDGWEPADAWTRSYHADHLLFREVVGRKRVLCAARTLDEHVIGREGLLAAPLRTPAGEVLGMCKVERIDFARLNVTTVETFRAICDWTGAALANARRHQLAEGQSMVDARYGIYSSSFLQKQTELFRVLARRLNFDVTMLILRAAHPEAAAEGFADALARIIPTVLRTTDLLFDHSRSGSEFTVILPGTPPQGAQVVIEKIKRELATQAPGLDLSFTIQSLHRVEADDASRRLAS